MNGTKLCHKPNVVYEYTCQFPGCDAVYVGETSKNLSQEILNIKIIIWGALIKTKNCKKNLSFSNIKLQNTKAKRQTLKEKFSDLIKIALVARQVKEFLFHTLMGKF